MPYPQEKLMAQEHQALRLEMAANRRFIFERPVLIITAGIAGLLGFSRIGALTPSILVFTTALAIPCLAVLWFNLWFTANRLRSNARIVAYIQLVHEPSFPLQSGTLRLPTPRHPWIGWETALHKWRRLEQRRSPVNPFPPSVPERSGKGIRSFYHPIFVLHVGAGLFIGALLAGELLYVGLAGKLQWFSADGAYKIAIAGIGFIAVAVYVALCMPYRRSDARHGIEYHRGGWKRVFHQLPS